MKVVIVTRHMGAVAWLQGQGMDGEIVPHLTVEDIEKYPRETIFIGVFPVPIGVRIVQSGRRCWAIELPSMTAEMRGRELSPEEMELAGARILELQLEHQRDGDGDRWWAEGSAIRQGIPEAASGDCQRFRIGLVPRSAADLAVVASGAEPFDGPDPTFKVQWLDCCAGESGACEIEVSRRKKDD